MTEAVVVVGVGMTTPVGLTAGETAASVRARTARFTETHLRDKKFDRFTVAEIPDDGVADLAKTPRGAGNLTAREARLLQLATPALRECLAPAGSLNKPVGLCLALPEMETKRPLNRPLFLQYFAAQTGNAFDLQGSDASHQGRAGGLIAIGQAVLTIQQGIADFVIAGGIDSYRDPYILGTLDLEQRVKSTANVDGFVPGEGAGFVLLAAAKAAAARGMGALATISPSAMSFEPGHLYSQEPYRGEGLAGALGQLVGLGAIEEPIQEVYSSMNGESHWAKEWGVGYLRNKALFNPAHAFHHPADCFGDTGAACGPIMVGLAVQGMMAQHRRAPAMVYASSDRGARAAVVLRSPLH